MLAVIATDGSEQARRAVVHAPSVLPAGTRLVLVSVIPPPILPHEDATGFAGPTMTPDEAHRVYSADAVAASAALAATASALGPVPIEQQILEGEPGPAICAFAAGQSAGVIVVGSHGRGAIASTLLGSVSTYIVAHATCPVLVVGAGVTNAGVGGTGGVRTPA